MEISPSALQDVKEMLKAEFGVSKMAERLKVVNECLESPDYLTVFSLENDTNKLDEAILQALIKGTDVLMYLGYCGSFLLLM